VKDCLTLYDKAETAVAAATMDAINVGILLLVGVQVYRNAKASFVLREEYTEKMCSDLVGMDENARTSSLFISTFPRPWTSSLFTGTSLFKFPKWDYFSIG